MIKREAAKHPAQSVGAATDGAEPSRAAQNEEWAWMVDEDPAFYLQETAPERRGG